jgi:hypothetical protein
MDCQFTLNKSETNESFKTLFKRKMNELLEVSPSDAEGSSKIIKTPSGYVGVLSVLSSQGRFIAETTGQSLDELSHDLFGALYNQIKIWRKVRFSKRQLDH